MPRKIHPSHRRSHVEQKLPVSQDSKWKNQALKYGLLALTVGAIGTAIYYNSYCKPFLTLNGVTVDNSIQDQPVSHFPDHFSRMAQNGMMSSASGRHYCIIETAYPCPSVCDSTSSQLQILARQGMDDNQYYSIMNRGSASVEGGFMVGWPSGPSKGIQWITFGDNPRKAENFKRALGYLEKNVLNDPRTFFSKPAKEIEQAMLASHRHLVTGFSTIEGSLTGLRKYLGLVTPPMKKHGIDALLELASEKGGWKQPELYGAVTRKFKSAITIDSLLRSLTEKEQEFVENYIGTITPDPADIPRLLTATAQLVKETGESVLKGSSDAVHAAANIHMKIAEVHAFKDGNGRLARLWMNLMLMLGGHQPVAFQSDETYTEAVMKAANVQVGAFESFLRETIHWNRSQGL